MINVHLKNIFLISLILLMPTSVFAQKDKNGCKISKDFIKNNDTNDSSIHSQIWKNSIDPDSDEYLATQHIIYKNGDMAVIEHKYCSMYNYELAYFVADDNFKTTPKNIGNLIGKVYRQSIAIRPDFKKPVSVAIKENLEKLDFSSEKPFSKGLDIADRGNKNIEQSINVIKLENHSTLYKYMFGYYIGIDGND